MKSTKLLTTANFYQIKFDAQRCQIDSQFVFIKDTIFFDLWGTAIHGLPNDICLLINVTQKMLEVNSLKPSDAYMRR